MLQDRSLQFNPSLHYLETGSKNLILFALSFCFCLLISFAKRKIAGNNPIVIVAQGFAQ
nr:MAG TPA: hypothetical protein [Caudoviricetes sp.]